MLNLSQDLYVAVSSPEELDLIQGKYWREEKELSKLGIVEEGYLTIDNKTYSPTEQFVKNFAGILKIPYPFATYIPITLLKENIEVLKEMNSRPVTIVYRKEGDTDIPINIFDMGTGETPKKIKELSCSSLFERYGNGKFSFRKAAIGDYGFTFDTLDNGLGKVDISKYQVGDIVSLGYRLYNPFTIKGTSLNMKLFAEQLKCSNGMTMPLHFGGTSLNLGNNLGDADAYFDRFTHQIDESIGQKFSLANLSNIFNNMIDTSIKYRFLLPLMNKVKGRPTVFAYMFGFEPDGPELKGFEKCYKEEEHSNSIFNYYDMIYKMTEKRDNLSLFDIECTEDYVANLMTNYLKQISLN